MATKNRRQKPAQKDDVEAVAEILRSGKFDDWNLEQITVEGSRQRLIPAEVYERAAWEGAKNYVRRVLKNTKMNVGTKEHPRYVRRFGCYYVIAEQEDGTTKREPCWKEWDEMDREQMISALQALYKHADNTKKEATSAKSYCNKLLINRGEDMLGKEEVR